MKGKLEFKQEIQGDGIIFAVYYNNVSCGFIRPQPEGGAWYRWGQITNYDTTLDECKTTIIEIFDQLDVFVERCKNIS